VNEEALAHWGLLCQNKIKCKINNKPLLRLGLKGLDEGWLGLSVLVFHLATGMVGLPMSGRLAVKNQTKKQPIGHPGLLTPWSRFLLEKVTGFQLVKKLPAFYGNGRFITAFTSARHLFLL